MHICPWMFRIFDIGLQTKPTAKFEDNKRTYNFFSKLDFHWRKYSNIRRLKRGSSLVQEHSSEPHCWTCLMMRLDKHAPLNPSHPDLIKSTWSLVYRITFFGPVRRGVARGLLMPLLIVQKIGARLRVMLIFERLALRQQITRPRREGGGGGASRAPWEHGEAEGGPLY